MRSIEVKLYTYNELTPKAQEKARDWYTSGYEFNPEFEPQETAAKLLGITYAQHSIPLMNGKTRSESDIRYSGFSSQGSGASFVGSYTFDASAAQAIRAEFPTDNTLASIADALAEIQSRYVDPLEARTSQRGNYVHSRTMDLDTYGPDALSDDDVALLLETLREFADWIYTSLRDEYDADHEDEVVADTILANEYEFTADGERYAS